MIDLHLHLDGSLSAGTLIRLANECKISLPSDDAKTLKPYMSAAKKSGSLDEYLKCFELPLAVMQTESTLKYAVGDLVRRLDESKMRYTEIRFAPQLHTRESMSQEAAVVAAIDGLDDALSGCKYMDAQLILCCMRGGNESENRETVRIAKKYLGSGVAAVDLAGAEGKYKTDDYKKVFALAEKLSVPFTIHAGEADGAQSVRAAVEMGASRIGHGIRVCEDESVVEMLIERGIALEMCPTSNLQTGAVGRIKDYPIQQLLKKGVIATVNTDNMTVSDTTLKKEYTLLKNSLSLTVEEEKMLLLNAVYASFMPEEKKQTLYEQIYGHALY